MFRICYVHHQKDYIVHATLYGMFFYASHPVVLQYVVVFIITV